VQERDLEVHLGVSNQFRITDGWSVIADAGFFDRGSNIRNYRLDNFEFGLSIGKAF